MTKNFALIGVAGFVAPRHLRAIADTGNRLIAATDPNDSVGILDRYFREARFFPEIERFDRHLEKLRRGPQEDRIHYVSICSPNYLHDAHVRLALRIRADAICEKPLVINPWNLDQLQEIERETGQKIYTVLQLRLHPVLQRLKAAVEEGDPEKVYDVCLTYITGRGPWYQVSWKGSPEKSGGLVTNIGIHFFDALIWIFGDVQKCEVHVDTPYLISGYLELRRARVRWLLSLDIARLPQLQGGAMTYRSITVEQEELKFTSGFDELHTRLYEETLAGRGFRVEDVRPSVELAHQLRHTAVTGAGDHKHPDL